MQTVGTLLIVEEKTDSFHVMVPDMCFGISQLTIQLTMMFEARPVRLIARTKPNYLKKLTDSSFG